MSELAALVPDIEALTAALDRADYIAEPGLAVACFLALRLPQPLLLEGEPGVGKTEAARAIAMVLDSPLLRLQCYEGLTAADALYEWDYARQLLTIRRAEATGQDVTDADLFDDRHLLRRPLLRAIEHPGPRPAVLLIDEVDRADDEFEAFLLELLADAAITIPQLGTVRAAVPPVVVLTSNRTRDLHDALKRRCLYHWIEYPSPERALAIVRRRVPESAVPLIVQAVSAVQRIRDVDLQKPPGIAETINWVAALTVLGVEQVDATTFGATLGSLCKYREDVDVVRSVGLANLL
jgi:MoxR-like ATPase